MQGCIRGCFSLWGDRVQWGHDVLHISRIKFMFDVPVAWILWRQLPVLTSQFLRLWCVNGASELFVKCGGVHQICPMPCDSNRNWHENELVCYIKLAWLCRISIPLDAFKALQLILSELFNLFSPSLDVCVCVVYVWMEMSHSIHRDQVTIGWHTKG